MAMTTTRPLLLCSSAPLFLCSSAPPFRPSAVPPHRPYSYVRVLIVEDNLMWSARLIRTITTLGHDAIVVTNLDQPQDADAAIVNLGAKTLAPETVVPKLRARGIHVIGHAGHKEKELHELGAEIGCDTLATNSELTFKLDKLLSSIGK